MKKTIVVSLFAATLIVAVFAFAQETQPSGDVTEDIGAIVDAVKSGRAVAIAAAIIMLLTNLLKAPWLGGLVKKIPARWRIAIPILLGGIAGILANTAGGMSWGESLIVGLFSGPTAVFAHEAVVEAILGKSKTRQPELNK